MAPDIRVVIEGRSKTFAAAHTARIGRAPDCDVVVANTTVSRHHAELRHRDGSWQLVDVGSRHGIHVDGHRVGELPLAGSTQARLGDATRGELVTLEPVAAAEAVPRRPAVDPNDPLLETRLPAPTTRPALTAVLDGQEKRLARTTVRVGREPGYELVSTNVAVSRLHARIEPRRHGWKYVDTSRGGTYRDGKRLRSLRIRERQELRLGDPVDGPSLVLIPEPTPALIARHNRRRRWRLWGVLLAAVLVFVSAVVVGVLLARSAGAGRLSDSALDRAKSATVRLEIHGGGGGGVGSGSIISADGLVLTNAHVARPRAPGLAPLYQEPLPYQNPRFLTVALTDSRTDLPAEPRYRARVVVADGYLDIAVLKIFARADGRPLDEPLDLPTVPLGSAGGLRTGDDITLLGFPGIAESMAVSVTRGLVSTFTPDPRLSPRAEIDTDARSAPGNSGGLAIDNEGNLIGLPFRGNPDPAQPVQSNRIRPIDFALPLIDIARRGGREGYVSPYVRSLDGDERARFLGVVARPDPSCHTVDPHVTTPAYAMFRLAGIERRLDVGAGVTYRDTGQSKSFAWRWQGERGGCLAVVVDAQRLAADQVPVEVRAGPRLVTIGAETLDPADLTDSGLAPGTQ